jgi:hypothetical protein
LPARAGPVIIGTTCSLPRWHKPVAFLRDAGYHTVMIIIRFAHPDMERRALGFLAGRFSFKTWDTGETAVPPQALGWLATEGISFIVEGGAKYEQLAPPRRIV